MQAVARGDWIKSRTCYNVIYGTVYCTPKTWGWPPSILTANLLPLLGLFVTALSLLVSKRNVLLDDLE
jgi:hypothetical protein